MKVFILLACLAGALAFSVDDVDFENLVPIYETVEFQEAFPEMAKLVTSIEHAMPVYKNRNGRIWGGREAVQGELPYQVGILVLLSRQSFCGGSLVSNNFVLTAASCFPGDPNAVVELGSVDRNIKVDFINAAQKIIHPNFDVSQIFPKATINISI